MAAVAIQHAESSHIKSALFDDETQELTVVFPKATAVYSGITQDVVNDFASAPSAGQFLATSIKGKYPFRYL